MATARISARDIAETSASPDTPNLLAGSAGARCRPSTKIAPNYSGEFSANAETARTGERCGPEPQSSKPSAEYTKTYLPPTSSHRVVVRLARLNSEPLRPS
jgi:hypothetical protein